MTLYILADPKIEVMRYYCPGTEAWPVLFESVNAAIAYARERCPDHVAYPVTREEAEAAVTEANEPGYVVMNRYGKIIRRWRRP